MHVSDKLNNMYGGYYEANPALMQKRAIAARQSVSHLVELYGETRCKSLLDIGAGEGAVLSELYHCEFAQELHAVEISDSGIEAIKQRTIPILKSLQRFDGYKINASSNSFSLGTAIHVLEHVEHERAFLEEITRVCELVYIEVPLELTARVERSIRESGVYGHINFYNAATFQNLLKTSGLEVLSFKVFPNSKEYEVNVSGRSKGELKFYIRSAFLKLAPGLAGYAMTYLGGAICRRTRKS